MTDSHLSELLVTGLQKSGEDPAQHPVDTYLAYLSLLLQWNRAYNLTGITDPEKIISHHILDSLSALPHIKGDRCLDVGSGAGLPGLILALARPVQQWTLLDSNGKKTRFLNQVVLELKIGNVEVVQARIEDHTPGIAYTTIISRALSSLPLMYQNVHHMTSEDGVMIAMKGKYPENEINQLRDVLADGEIMIKKVSSTTLHRHLVII